MREKGVLFFMFVLNHMSAYLKNDKGVQHGVVQSSGGDVAAVAQSQSLGYGVFGGVVCAGHDV